MPDSGLWHYRVGSHRICASYGHTKKNETLRTALEYGRCKKYAPVKDYFHEQAMEQNHRVSQIPTRLYGGLMPATI